MPELSYYNILEVEPTATLQEIKSAFRRLALVYHPDRNAGADAAGKFSQLHKAYHVLGDRDRRRAYDMQLNMGIPVEEANQQVVYITDRVWMKISRKRVKPGESFSVIIRSFKRSNEPVLKGLEQFEVLNHYSQVIMIQDRPVREVLYVLKSDKEGIFKLGPASLRQGRYEYISGFYDVTVSLETNGVDYKGANRAAYIVFTLFCLFLAGNVIYYTLVASKVEQPGYTIKVMPLSPDDTAAVKPVYRQLPTGAAPYEDVLGENVFAETFNEVRLKNGKDFDVVVCLANVKNNKTVRHHYIKAGEEYTISSVPDGDYYLKAIFGKDWDPEMKMNDLGTTGGFTRQLHYQVFSGKDLVMKMHKKKGEKHNYNLYEFTLYPTASGNASAQTVDEGSFFNKKQN